MSTFTKGKLLAVLQPITNWTPDQIEDRIFGKTALNSLKVDQIKSIFRAMKDEGISISYQANKPVLVGMLDKIIDCINTNTPLPYPTYGYTAVNNQNVNFTHTPAAISYNSVAQNKIPVLPGQQYPMMNNITSANRVPSNTVYAPPVPLVYQQPNPVSYKNGFPPSASSDLLVHKQPKHQLVYAAPVVKHKIPVVVPMQQKLSSRDQAILNDLLEVEGLSKEEILKSLREFPVDQEKDSDSVLLWLLNQRQVSFIMLPFISLFFLLAVTGKYSTTDRSSYSDNKRTRR
jgi:hypothetical protein